MAKPKVRESWMIDWIHVDLSQEDKENYRAWDFEETDVIEALGAHVVQGYKFGCTYNPQNQSFQASLTCQREGDTNSGLGVSGFAADLWAAVRVLMYKVVVILPADWRTYEPPGGKDIG